jgi:hypothetical protein
MQPYLLMDKQALARLTRWKDMTIYKIKEAGLMNPK